MENPSAMTVLLVEPEKHPQVVEIGSDLKSLQSAVGGMIETVYPFEENVGLIVDGSGSGKTRFRLKPNLLQLHSSYVLTDPKMTVS